jgi:hypothetical protein
MFQKYLAPFAGAVATCLLFMGTANALFITGGVGNSTSGVGIEGIGDQCLEIGGVASTAPVTPVHAWECNANLNQMWIVTNGQIEKINDGRFTCLEVVGASKAAGAKVQLNYCNGGTNQQWVLNQKGEIVGVGSELCLDWEQGYYQNGVQLQIEPCNDGPEQQFWLR